MEQTPEVKPYDVQDNLTLVGGEGHPDNEDKEMLNPNQAMVGGKTRKQKKQQKKKQQKKQQQKSKKQQQKSKKQQQKKQQKKQQRKTQKQKRGGARKSGLETAAVPVALLAAQQYVARKLFRKTNKSKKSKK